MHYQVEERGEVLSVRTVHGFVVSLRRGVGTFFHVSFEHSRLKGLEARLLLKSQLQTVSAVLGIQEPTLLSQLNSAFGFWGLQGKNPGEVVSPSVVLQETAYALDSQSFVEQFNQIVPRRDKIMIG